MNSRTVLPIVAVAALVALAIAFFRAPGTRGSGAASDPPAAASDGAGSDLQAAPVERAFDVRDAVPALEASDVGSDLDAPSLTRPPVGAHVLRVVDEDGVPVAGAEVEVHSYPMGGSDLGVDSRRRAHFDRERLRTAGRPLGPWDLAWEGARGWQSARTDASGRVHVRPPEEQGSITARRALPGRVEFGSLALAPGLLRLGVETELVIRPVRTCVVLVLDADGVPARNVPVALVAVAPRREARFTNGGSTGEGGRIVILDRDGAWSAPPSGFEEWRVRALVASAEPIDAPLPADGEEVVLRLPHTGTVRIEFPRALSGASVTLASRRSLAWRPLEGDVVEFEGVGLGLELTATVARAGGSSHETFAGPRSPGEVVVHHFRAAEAGYALRLVDELGAPVSRAWLDLRWRVPMGTHSYEATVSARTDDSGAILERPPHAEATRLGVRTSTRDANGYARVMLGSLELPPLGESGAVDLGTLVLVREPLLAAGRVTDRSGSPVEGALVRVIAADPPPRTFASARTDEDGRFVLSGDVGEGAACALVAWAPGYALGEPLPMRAGLGDHHVVLDDGAHVEVRLLLDSAERHDEVHVRLDLGTRSIGLNALGPVRDHERVFALESIPPGNGSLVVVPSPAGLPLTERPVRLVGGERTDAGRIELVHGLPTFELVVLDEDGAPIESYRWRRIVADEAGPWRSARAAPNALLVPGVPAHVEVTVEGHPPVREPIQGERVVVRFGASSKAILRLPAGYPLPAEDLGLCLSIHRVDGEGPAAGRLIPFSTAHEFEVALAPGRYRAALVGGSTRNLVVTFELTASDLESRRGIDLAFDLAAWREALREAEFQAR